MSKKELIYSQQASDFIEGKAYSNPRYFSTPRADVSKVLIYGHWPAIAEAYTAIGVPVEQLDAPPVVAPVPAASPIALATAIEAAQVAIPDNWRDLPWTRGEGLTLRALASSVSSTPVLNKAQATEAIEAELANRAKTVTGDGSGDALPVLIPDNWRDIAEAERIALAKDLGWVDGEPTADQANAWIADAVEHRRREEPQEALGGRSIREAHDIITKAGGEWKDGSSVEELAELLQLAEA